MKNNTKFKLIIISLFIMISLMTSAIAVTYAWFSNTHEEDVRVTSGTLAIDYEKDEIISAINLKPATKEQVLEGYNKGSCKYQVNNQDEIYEEQICYYNNMTITNTGSLASTISIILRNVINTYSDNLKYEVFVNTPDELVGNSLLDETLLTGFPSEYYLPVGNSVNYTLLIWLDENATIEDENKTYSASVEVLGTQTNEHYVAFEGVMVDEHDNILSNVNLSMFSNPKHTMTDENGYFDFGYVEAGTHKIIAHDEENNQLLNDQLIINKGSTKLVQGKEVIADTSIAVKIIKSHNAPSIKKIVLLTDPLENNEEPQEEIITPILLSGMIPIKYDGSKWVKADATNLNNNWYNYDNKRWANIVLINENEREKYEQANVETEILESDILAYYVWIPRYSYKLFNVNYLEAQYNNQGICISNCPEEIEIVFETINTVLDGTCNGDYSKPTNDCYYTHPAFGWDNDSGGTRDLTEEIPGFWFSKFQIGGSDNEPVILPNKRTVNHQKLYNQQQMVKEIKDEKYFNENVLNQVDSHITKNTEWGAVTYLSHSTYGINTKIRNNNIDALNSKYVDGMSLTGCAAATSDEPQKKQTTCDYSYDEPTIGVLASTTGNITGIYDMAGASLEHVMGIIKNRLGYLSYSQSGLNFFTLPVNSKYVNAYNYNNSSNNNKALNITLLGDATGETNSWYNNNNNYPHSSINTIFARGGNYVGNQFTFSSVNGSGIFDYNIACRSVLVIK